MRWILDERLAAIEREWQERIETLERSLIDGACRERIGAGAVASGRLR